MTQPKSEQTVDALDREQYLAFATIAMNIMEAEQIEECMASFHALCRERGWIEIPGEDPIDPAAEAAINRVLDQATRRAAKP